MGSDHLPEEGDAGSDHHLCSLRGEGSDRPWEAGEGSDIFNNNMLPSRVLCTRLSYVFYTTTFLAVFSQIQYSNHL